MKINNNNNELNALLNMFSSNNENIDLNTIYKSFNEEFEIIKNKIDYYNKNYNKKNYKIVSKEIQLNIPHKIRLENLLFTFGPSNNKEITKNKKSYENNIQTNEKLPKNIVKNDDNDFKQKIIAEKKK